MAHLSMIGFGLELDPPLANDTTARILCSPDSLCLHGMNFPVTVTTPALLCAPPASVPRQAISVMAHLDTGASCTCIDESLAAHLGLICLI